jgi:uncharacterized membrane protein
MTFRDRPLDSELARDAGQSAYRTALDILLTGVVVLLPIVVTVYVLDAALRIIVSVLDPFVKLMEYVGILRPVRENVVVAFLVRVGIYRNEVVFIEEITAMVVLGAVVVGIGVATRSQYGERAVDWFDYFVTIIPGVGSVYRSFRRMGDAMLDSEVENFRSVKLVEFPRDGSYVIGFETAESPASIRKSARSPEMRTIFLPMAPNPVMGGFLSHIPDERIIDVDMTVEEGIQSIVTSGVAVQGGDLSREELRKMGVAEADLPERGETSERADRSGESPT